MVFDAMPGIVNPYAPGLEHAYLRADSDFVALLKSKRRKEPLQMPELDKFLDAHTAGMISQAYVEKRDDKWRIRFAVPGDKGFPGRILHIVDRDVREKARDNLPRGWERNYMQKFSPYNRYLEW